VPYGADHNRNKQSQPAFVIPPLLYPLITSHHRGNVLQLGPIILFNPSINNQQPFFQLNEQAYTNTIDEMVVETG